MVSGQRSDISWDDNSSKLIPLVFGGVLLLEIVFVV